MIYEQMLNESKRLEKQIQDIHIQLESLPNGKLVCCFILIKFLFVMNVRYI